VFLSSTVVWAALTIVTLFFGESFGYQGDLGPDPPGWHGTLFKALEASHAVALAGFAIIAARWFWAHAPGDKSAPDPPL
jgi:hypothetical protein